MKICLSVFVFLGVLVTQPGFAESLPDDEARKALPDIYTRLVPIDQLEILKTKDEKPKLHPQFKAIGPQWQAWVNENITEIDLRGIDV